MRSILFYYFSIETVALGFPQKTSQNIDTSKCPQSSVYKTIFNNFFSNFFQFQFLSFPTSGTNNSQNQPFEQKFSFSISDIEGPRGSFECIQQSHGQMNVLGALQYKMIVQAKEDVFAHTKIQMATQAEIQKTKR